ncbi:malate dehydrogenase [Epithele typhae]|uniref:malate dehydrogenase n=1 Tax=Epithele typhae TaxID=378194 RepID=UPI0020078D2E|nr:malate dehydrogenase [Epithele typhae]KAH9936898.1 malate dehydrogenase [Epithele typhae]
MFARTAARSLASSSRAFSTSAARQSKVTVLGAGGGIGQPLSLLLKLNPHVTELSLYDIRGAPGVAADVSHIDTKSEVNGFTSDKLDQALEGTDVVVIPAGVPRKMTRDDLFNTNASIVRDLAAAIARVSPKAHVLVISNPVNSTVPIVSAVFEKAGVYDPARIFGVTTLDVVRAQRFLAGLAGADPKQVPVTVVGGHSGATIVPLISQTMHANADGAGSATLSMAYAGARFTGDLLRPFTARRSPLYADQGIEYFSSNVELGPNGVEKILPVGAITKEEEELLAACLPSSRRTSRRASSSSRRSRLVGFYTLPYPHVRHRAKSVVVHRI